MGSPFMQYFQLLYVGMNFKGFNCHISLREITSSLVRQAYAVTIKCDAWPMFKICSDDTIGFTLIGDSCREKFELMISDLELRHYGS